MDPSSAGPASARYAEARERLRKIVPPEDERGDIAMDRLPLDVQPFSEFLDSFPEWKGPKAFICPEVKNSLVQRVQHSGLCFFHAPVVVQHYLVARSGAKLTGMIDIAKFIRKHYSVRSLYDYIFNDEGGNSVHVLRHILQPGSVVSDWPISLLDKTQLEKFGPHLLAMFEVHDDFMHDNKLSYRGAPPQLKKEPGHHAMVIVGVRTTEDGSKVFLLQNWWADKQFVEVDEAYIEACSATSYFVKTPQLEIPTKFEATFNMYAETTMDKEETYPKEGGE